MHVKSKRIFFLLPSFRKKQIAIISGKSRVLVRGYGSHMLKKLCMTSLWGYSISRSLPQGSSNLIYFQWLPMNSWTTFRSRLPLKWTFLKTPSLRARSGSIAGTFKTPELEQALSLSALKVRKWFNPHTSNFKTSEFQNLSSWSLMYL